MAEDARSTMERASGWQLLKRNRAALVALWVLVGMVVLSLVGPPILVSIFGDSARGYSEYDFAPPGTVAAPVDGERAQRYLFGTDISGRDLFYRVLMGARVSLLVGLAGAAVSLVLGTVYGVVSGFCGGKIDAFMMRVVDILYSIPRLLFLMIFIAAFGKRFHDGLDGLRLAAQGRGWEDCAELLQALLPYSRIGLLIVALGLIEWLVMARIVRGQVLVLREMTFVKAARALGQTPFGIVRRHLLPNLTTLILTYLTLTVPAVVLDESFLSFLGLGIENPAASWGSLLREGAEAWNVLDSHWWLLVFPAVFMSVTMLAFNFLGDGLRDAFDPKSSR